MTFEELLDRPPIIHGGGTSSSHHLSTDVLRFLFNTLPEGASTLETGIGVSTVVFALKSCKHTCIAPVDQEINDIRTFCQKNGISLQQFNFQIQPSERALPQLHLQNLDLVLIDGNHAFPIPFIDYFYTSTMLKVGGYLVIDDVHIWTGKVLKEFLMSENDWRLMENFYDRTSVFQKISEVDPTKWHGQQPFVVQKSRWEIKKSHVRQLLNLLKNGEFPLLMKKLKGRF